MVCCGSSRHLPGFSTTSWGGGASCISLVVCCDSSRHLPGFSTTSWGGPSCISLVVCCDSSFHLPGFSTTSWGRPSCISLVACCGSSRHLPGPGLSTTSSPPLVEGGASCISLVVCCGPSHHLPRFSTVSWVGPSCIRFVDCCGSYRHFFILWKSLQSISLQVELMNLCRITWPNSPQLPSQLLLELCVEQAIVCLPFKVFKFLIRSLNKITKRVLPTNSKCASLSG